MIDLSEHLKFVGRCIRAKRSKIRLKISVTDCHHHSDLTGLLACRLQPGHLATSACGLVTVAQLNVAATSA